MHTANGRTAYLEGNAYAPASVSDEGVATESSAPSLKNNLKSTVPPGIGIAECADGLFGAAAYFTAELKGFPPLKRSAIPR